MDARHFHATSCASPSSGPLLETLPPLVVHVINVLPRHLPNKLLRFGALRERKMGMEEWPEEIVWCKGKGIEEDFKDDLGRMIS